MREYHDTEWGVPLYDDRKLFEFLVLEGMQAGLSWLCVLNKRENFRRTFGRFDPEKVARAFLEAREEFGSFQRFMWGFVDGKPLARRRRRLKKLPATNRESDAMSKEMKLRGFRFVGSTICYATGHLDPHLLQVSEFDLPVVLRAVELAVAREDPELLPKLKW